MDANHRHQCFIYEGEPSNKLPVIASIISKKMNEGYRCLYLNSTPMIAGMRSTLVSMGIDVSSEIADSSLVLSSEPVSTDGKFEVDAMLRKLEDSIDQALKDGFKGLWASGDMTWEFGSTQNFDKLIEYELKLEEIFARRKEFCGICQYHRDTMPSNAVRQGLLMHRGVVVNQTLSRINPHYLRSAWPVDSTVRQQLDETINLLCGS